MLASALVSTWRMAMDANTTIRSTRIVRSQRYFWFGSQIWWTVCTSSILHLEGSERFG